MKKNADQDYSDAFNEAAGVVVAEKEPDAKSEVESDPAAVVVVATEAEPVVEGESPAAVDGAEKLESEEAPMTEAELQAERSWKGRLKKKEEELARMQTELEAKMAAASAPVEDLPAHADAPPKAFVEDAEMDGKVSKVAEDFGQDFIDVIAYLARKAGAGAVTPFDDAPLRDKIAQLEEMSESLKGGIETLHFGPIDDAHDDWSDIFESEAYKAWVEALPDTEKARALKMYEQGSSRGIIKLLDRYKESLKAQESPASDMAEELMEPDAVRASAPVTLPSKPAAADSDDDFSKYFKEASTKKG